jgi:uncharacterized repeat protein (TIGR01451 family)
VVVCDLGTVPFPGSANATLVVFPNTSGILTNTAQVAASTYDPDTINNSAEAQITADPSADLSLTKVPTTGPYYVGQPLTYTLTVSNPGPSTAAAVTLTDTLPVELDFVSVSPTPDCTEAGGIVTCDFGELAPTGTASATLVVSPNTNGTLTNTAQVAASTFDPNTGDNSAEAQITVELIADLSLTKSPTTGPFYVGQPLTYTLTATNSGPTNAETVTLTDTLPVELDFVSVSPTPDCTEAGGVVTCGFGELTPTGTVSATLVVSPNTNGTLTNTAQVASSTYDPNTEDNSAEAQITVDPIADLSLTKVPTAGPYYVGQPLTYTLTVNNPGPSTATTVTLTDTLPVELDFVSVSPTPDCTEAGGVVTCNFGELTSTGTVSATLVVSPNTSGTFTNTAQVTASTYDPDTTNNSAEVQITANPSADLSLTKVPTNGPYYVGQPLTYTLNVNNPGPSTATTVTLTDTLPVELDFVSVSPTPDCAEAGGVVTCGFGELTPTGTASATLVVIPTTSGTFTNTAQVTASTFDPNTGDNSTEAQTTVDPIADLSLAKVPTAGPYYVGQPLTYTLTATNSGPSTAATVTLTDTLPAGLTYVSATGPGECAANANVVVCDLGTIPFPGSANATLVVTPNISGTLTNTAQVAASTYDLDTINNSTEAQITAITSADLSLTKVPTTGPYYVGQPLTYTLNVNNPGPTTATTVTLTDTLPVELDFVSVSPTPDCTEAGGVVTCDFGELAPTGTASATLVVIPNTSGTLTNTAQVAASTYDPNTGDNSALSEITAEAIADLSVMKTDHLDPVIATQALVYTSSVVNLGPSTAVNAVLTDTLSDAVTFTSFSTIPTGISCSENSNVVVCDLGDLLSGEGVTITIETTADYGGLITNTVNVASETADLVPENNTDSENTTVTPSADLSISKSGIPDPVYAGNSLLYRITIRNNGPDIATNVVLTDTLPTNVEWQSTTSDQGSCQGTELIACQLGDVPPYGGNPDNLVTIFILVDTITGAPLTNTASISSDIVDLNLGNNQVEESTLVIPVADLSVTKTDQPDPTYYLFPLTYTLSISNQGPDPASNVRITDTLPGGVQFGSATLPGGTCSGNTVITCDLTELQSGENTEVTILVTPTITGPIENTASISSDVEDIYPSDNEASQTTNVLPAADLEVSKSGEPEILFVGETLTYTITAVNHGTSTATDVIITDNFPAELDIISLVPSKGSCNLNGDIVCQVSSMARDETVTITIVAEAINHGLLSNEVSISSGFTDLDLTNNSDLVETTVYPILDLSITQVDQPDPVTAQEILEYMITIHNDGPSDATNVILEDTLDSGVTYESVAPAGTACSLAEQLLECSLGTVLADQTMEITITTRTKMTTTGMITNSVYVSNDIFDPVAANDTSVTTTYLPPDNTPPTVAWTEPTTKGGETSVGAEVVRLAAASSDNVAIDYVLFKRWDGAKWVEIARDHSAPYQWDFATFVLNPGYNQINVEAYDTAGNKAPVTGQEFLWLIYNQPSNLEFIYIPLIKR